MKKLLTLAAALAASTLAMAHDSGRFVSAIPVVERVAVAGHACTTRPMVGNRPIACDDAGQRRAVRTTTGPWDAPHGATWSGHRRQPAVRYISTERRGNTWEDDFLDRQMR